MTQPAPDEVREKALALLACIRDMRASGRGELPLSELFEMLAPDADPAIRAQLEARGAIELEFGPDGGGRFSNSGPAVSVKYGPGELVVPPEIAGAISTDDTRLELDFDEGRAVVGKALFIELPVQRLEVSDHHVAVRLPGGIFDVERKF